MSRLAAVTGGTGFIGRHVTAALAAAGWRLRLLARRDLSDGENAETVRGSLADPGALTALVDGADAVIQIAGVIKAPSRSDFMAVNRDGTAALAAAWRRRAADARFVLVSSLAAREPSLSHYAASKAAGETALGEATGGGAVVLRPSAVYGPGDRETLGLFRTAGWPVQPVLNGPEARVALIHVADLATAVVAAARPEMPPGTYELSDARAEGYSWREIAGAACAVCGRTARPVRVPAAVLRLAGLWGDVLALCGAAPMLTSGKRREILHSDWSSRVSAHLPASLWQPERDIGRGFAETVAWYRAAGWLSADGGRGLTASRITQRSKM